MLYNGYDLMTPYEVMDYLDIGENSLYKLLNSGDIGAFRIDRKWRVPRKELDAYIDRSVEKRKKSL